MTNLVELKFFFKLNIIFVIFVGAYFVLERKKKNISTATLYIYFLNKKLSINKNATLINCPFRTSISYNFYLFFIFLEVIRDKHY